MCSLNVWWVNFSKDKPCILFLAGVTEEYVPGDRYCYAPYFPYDNEFVARAPIAKLVFTTDFSVNNLGFRLNFRAVQIGWNIRKPIHIFSGKMDLENVLGVLDYDPSAATTSATAAGQAAAASESTDDCDDAGMRWRWRCLTSAERALLICVVILLIVCIILCVVACVYFCNCVRPREKVKPVQDDEFHRSTYISPENGKVLLADSYHTAIPYKEDQNTQFSTAPNSDTASNYSSEDKFRY